MSKSSVFFTFAPWSSLPPTNRWMRLSRNGNCDCRRAEISCSERVIPRQFSECSLRDYLDQTSEPMICHPPSGGLQDGTSGSAQVCMPFCDVTDANTIVSFLCPWHLDFVQFPQLFQRNSQSVRAGAFAVKL